MKVDKILKFTEPFHHYTFTNFFTKRELKQYKSVDHHGETGNSVTKTRTSSKRRIFVGGEMCKTFPLADKMRSYFCKDSTVSMFESFSGRKSPEYLRIEIIKDIGEIWLEPHLDIHEKFLSILIFINDCGEEPSLGTDLYTKDFRVSKTVPYIDNTGYFFYPSMDSWHGLERKIIKTHRKVIMVNYVTFPTEILIKNHR